MRAPLLALPLLLAAAPASAGEGAGAPAPAVNAPADPSSNTGSAPPAVPAAKPAPKDDFDEEPEPSGPPGPATVFVHETVSAGLHWTGGAMIGIAAGNVGLSGSGRAADRHDLGLAVANLAGPFLAGWGADWVGAYDDRPGGFWTAVAGAAAGEAAGFGIVQLVDRPTRLQDYLFPALGAAVGAAAGSLATSTPPADPAPAVAGLAVAPDGGLVLTLAGAF